MDSKAISLSDALRLMDEKDDATVFLTAENNRLGTKWPMSAADANQDYGGLISSKIWPYISTDGEYLGNVYVCPDFSAGVKVPAETQSVLESKGKYKRNAESLPLAPSKSWHLGDKALLISNDGKITPVTIRAFKFTPDPVTAIVQLPNEIAEEVTPDLLFEPENLTLYDVTISRVGSVKLYANSPDMALRAAEKCNNTDIQWLDSVPTDATPIGSEQEDA